MSVRSSRQSLALASFFRASCAAFSPGYAQGFAMDFRQPFQIGMAIKAKRSRICRSSDGTDRVNQSASCDQLRVRMLDKTMAALETGSVIFSSRETLSGARPFDAAKAILSLRQCAREYPEKTPLGELIAFKPASGGSAFERGASRCARSSFSPVCGKNAWATRQDKTKRAHRVSGKRSKKSDGKPSGGRVNKQRLSLPRACSSRDVRARQGRILLPDCQFRAICSTPQATDLTRSSASGLSPG